MCHFAVCQRLCVGPWIKFLYISCATLLTASFIIQCILLHLVIVPFFTESAFRSDLCTFNQSIEINPIRCENKCSKDRSTFPCLQISVNYKTPNGVRKALIYDYYNTFAHYRSFKCATSPCRKREEENREWVEEFRDTLKRRGTFDCYTSETHPNEALLHKVHLHVFLHSLLWPLILFIGSFITLIITYCIDRGRVWADDKTVFS